ncbi:hypothetical protein [Haliscomenobacter hydrossis]|uniref:Outer membrane protein n=1 Tax=Haliscomenobacter hydrossis (strain ATCC 27775 / DSM 1100 / LMG 10767 / O) TaxID=760192 RepID=F4L1D9_HALH1|nr:hypothetical protein [Haliscomenobacter hydrossis]AEE53836.1 hypothetical protein Halhy_6013 [Haliscomenobacter hydrossis DSM 1100]
MKKNAALLVYLATIFVCRGQTPDSSNLDIKTFNSIINNQFSNLINGQSQNSIGNYASLDLKNSEVVFSGSSTSKNGHIFGINASGGISDGVLSLFNNSRFNTKISLEGHLNFLQLKNKQLTYSQDSYLQYAKKRADLEEKYELLIMAAEYENGLNSLKLTKKRTELLLSSLSELSNKETNINRKDSIAYVIALKKREASKIDSLIKMFPGKNFLIEEISNSRAIELKKIKPDLEIYGFHFKWFAIKYKVTNNSFKLFNPASSFQNQVSNSNYVSHEFKFQYNNYNWSAQPFETFFYSFGISIAVTDNLTSLQKIELSEVTEYGTANGARSSTSKYNAFVGTYQKNLQQFKIYTDYFKFLFKDNVCAIHLFPEYVATNKSVPIFNLGVGFLFAFKNLKKEEKSNINIELFYSMSDVTKNTATNLRLFERNNIGLRFSFPVSFINKN